MHQIQAMFLHFARHREKPQSNLPLAALKAEDRIKDFTKVQYSYKKFIIRL
jgi:hypothetical protein